jgi:hypothetical protein
MNNGILLAISLAVASVAAGPAQAALELPRSAAPHGFQLAQSRCGIGWDTCSRSCGIQFSACQVGKKREENLRVCNPQHDRCIQNCRRQHCH